MTTDVTTVNATLIRSTSDNFTEWTTDLGQLNEWEKLLLIFEGINIALIVIVLWLLLSLIVYGIKTGRFRRKAQSSSLNSGLIFNACVFAVLGLLPRLVITAIWHILRRHDISFDCETRNDISTFGYALSLYGIYMFFWARQRVIYTNPFVKSKVNKVMNWISRGYGIFVTAVTLALICVFIPPKSYFYDENVCYEYRPAYTTYIVGGSYFIAQILMLCLCIYPATRVSIQTSPKSGVSTPQTGSQSNGVETVTETQQTSKPGSSPGCCFCVSGVVMSPIEATIKRTVISSVIVVVTDVLAVVLEAIIFPTKAPALLKQTLLDISSCLDLFCILWTFGFAFKVFTLFCPSCPKRNEGNSRTESASVIESTVDLP